MTGEELFLNELNFHIRQGISKKDLTDLINERLKQLTIPVVSSMFSAKQMEKAYNDGVEAEQQRCGDFDIENYC